MSITKSAMFIRLCCLCSSILIFGNFAVAAEKKVLFKDDFSKSDLSEGWSGIRDCVKIADGRMTVEFPGQRRDKAAYAKYAYLMVSDSKDWQDVEVSARMMTVKAESKAAYIPHIILRKQPENYKHYAVSLWCGKATLSKGFGAGVAQGKEELNPAIPHLIRVGVRTLKNNTVAISVYCDGNPAIEYVDSDKPYLSGPLGIFAPFCTAAFDEFSVCRAE